MHVDELTASALANPAWLSVAEEQVLALASRDSLDSVEAPPEWISVIRRAAGVRLSNGLADPRLEALRRYAVLSRLAPHRVDEHERQRLADQRFSPASVAVIDDRLGSTRRSGAAVMWVASGAGGLAGVSIFAWLRLRLEDSLVAAMLIALLSIPFVILGAPRSGHPS